MTPAPGLEFRGGKKKPPSAAQKPPPIDVQTVDARGGGLGGPRNDTPPVDTQTITQRGGGLGGDVSGRNTTDTKTITQRGGGLSTRGGKQPLNPVIDKRTVKQKLKDAQTRRNM